MSFGDHGWFSEHSMKPKDRRIHERILWSCALHNQALEMKLCATDREVRSIKARHLGFEELAYRTHGVARMWFQMACVIMEVSEALEQ
jgi:hypothetical protein